MRLLAYIYLIFVLVVSIIGTAMSAKKDPTMSVAATLILSGAIVAASYLAAT